MVLVLVTGFVLASSPIFKKLLSLLAGRAKKPGQAIVLVTLVSLIASWVNWGFGLVIGALFAKELAKKVSNVDYRLLIASAYSGFLVWHGGLAGSIPLTIATEDHFMQDVIGIISTDNTIFAAFNLAIVAALFIILPILNAKLGLAFLVYYFVHSGFSLNLNIVNFTFLFLGLLFHGTPKKFIGSVKEAVSGASGIIIQFPFYAGIMGMMVASGLAKEMSSWFVSISTDFTFPFFAFLSAGIVNFFVPSGGGQWAVQAPIMLDAAKELGVSIPKTAMAVAWGDAWTNMIQPFWALPALAIAGLKAKDIMGFCLIVLFVSGLFISLGLLFL